MPYSLGDRCEVLDRKFEPHHRHVIFPYDPFEYRLSLYVVSFITFYNLVYCIVELRVMEIRVLRKIIWSQCEEVRD